MIFCLRKGKPAVTKQQYIVLCAQFSLWLRKKRTSHEKLIEKMLLLADVCILNESVGMNARMRPNFDQIS